MDASELARLLETNDYYGLVLGACGLFAARHHPGAEYAVLAVHLRDGVPDVMVPIIPAAASGPTPPPATRRP